MGEHDGNHLRAALRSIIRTEMGDDPRFAATAATNPRLNEDAGAVEAEDLRRYLVRTVEGTEDLFVSADLAGDEGTVCVLDPGADLPGLAVCSVHPMSDGQGEPWVIGHAAFLAASLPDEDGPDLPGELADAQELYPGLELTGEGQLWVAGSTFFRPGVDSFAGWSGRLERLLVDVAAEGGAIAGGPPNAATLRRVAEEDDHDGVDVLDTAVAAARAYRGSLGVECGRMVGIGRTPEAVTVRTALPGGAAEMRMSDGRSDLRSRRIMRAGLRLSCVLPVGIAAAAEGTPWRDGPADGASAVEAEILSVGGFRAAVDGSGTVRYDGFVPAHALGEMDAILEDVMRRMWSTCQHLQFLRSLDGAGGAA